MNRYIYIYICYKNNTLYLEIKIFHNAKINDLNPCLLKFLTTIFVNILYIYIYIYITKKYFVKYKILFA